MCVLGEDLFILDQHACDEKYRFEELQRTTSIHQQPLLRCVAPTPPPSHLTPPPSSSQTPSAGPHSGRGAGGGREPRRVRAQRVQAARGRGRATGPARGAHRGPLQQAHAVRPRRFAPGTPTGCLSPPPPPCAAHAAADVHELASLLRDHAGARRASVRLPKVLAMFASRACRSAIMIGSHLDHAEMRKVRGPAAAAVAAGCGVGARVKTAVGAWPWLA